MVHEHDLVRGEVDAPRAAAARRAARVEVVRHAQRALRRARHRVVAHLAALGLRVVALRGMLVPAPAREAPVVLGVVVVLPVREVHTEGRFRVKERAADVAVGLVRGRRLLLVDLDLLVGEAQQRLVVVRCVLLGLLPPLGHRGAPWLVGRATTRTRGPRTWTRVRPGADPPDNTGTYRHWFGCGGLSGMFLGVGSVLRVFLVCM